MIGPAGLGDFERCGDCIGLAGLGVTGEVEEIEDEEIERRDDWIGLA